MALERRTYLLRPDDLVFVGRGEVEELFLEVREATTGQCVTVLELPCPRP